MADAKKQDIVIKKTYNAPVERVWQAWTDPEWIMKWWGPDHFTSPSCEIDFKEGGRYVFAMRAPKEMGGMDMYTAGTFTSIIPGEVIELTQTLSDQNGSAIDPTSIGMPADFPTEPIRTRLVFKPLGGNKSELTVTEFDWQIGQQRQLSEMGMSQSLDKLARLFTDK